jgi:hypothetical protein
VDQKTFFFALPGVRMDEQKQPISLEELLARRRQQQEEAERVRHSFGKEHPSDF